MLQTQYYCAGKLNFNLHKNTSIMLLIYQAGLPIATFRKEKKSDEINATKLKFRYLSSAMDGLRLPDNYHLFISTNVLFVCQIKSNFIFLYFYVISFIVM